MTDQIKKLLTHEDPLWRDLAKEILEKKHQILKVKDLSKEQDYVNFPNFILEFYLKDNVLIALHYYHYKYEQGNTINILLQENYFDKTRKWKTHQMELAAPIKEAPKIFTDFYCYYQKSQQEKS